MTKVNTYMRVWLIAVLMSCAFFNQVKSQGIFSLTIRSVDKDSVYVARELGLKTLFKTERECDEYLLKLPELLQNKGFLGASIDSVINVAGGKLIDLFIGEHFKFARLQVKESDKLYLQQAGWQYKTGESVSFNFYKTSTEKLIDYFEDNGYPFAKISLDSVIVLNNNLEAVLNIEKGFVYRLDSIRVYGPAEISKNFIHRYLNIDRGSIYSKSKLEKIDQRLLELPYLEQMQPWDLSMLNTGSLVNLYLKPRKSNQVNVLAGFLPSNNQVGGKLLLTVDANLQLQNAFGSGESLTVLWQQIQPKSPRLNLQYTQPYMFKSPFGIDFLFQLYKKDSAYLNLNAQVGLLYMLSPNKTGKVILQTQRTNVLEMDTVNIKTVKKLPDVIDVGSLNVGIDYDVVSTNYRFNPRRGYELGFSALLGNKNIRKSTILTQIKDSSFNYGKLYDSIKLKAYQLRLRFRGAQYVSIGKQAVIKTAINAGLYESPNYFRNELFQIGGYRLLRGFDEESIFTNRFVVGTLEYRYLVGLNSNFSAFTDFGYANNKITRQSNTYMGGGIGLSFETKGGIFNISYAAGKRNDLNFDIKQSKIHFGYVSVF